MIQIIRIDVFLNGIKFYREAFSTMDPQKIALSIACSNRMYGYPYPTTSAGHDFFGSTSNDQRVIPRTL